MDPPSYRGPRGRPGSNPPPLFEDTSLGGPNAPGGGVGHGGHAPGGYGGYDDPWAQQVPSNSAPYAGGGYGAEPAPAAGLLDPTKLAAAAGFSAPMAGVAAQYGQQLADQGRVQVEQKLESWFAISKLKYYFAVDNSYVGKKLALLLFPYAQRWGGGSGRPGIEVLIIGRDICLKIYRFVPTILHVEPEIFFPAAIGPCLTIKLSLLRQETQWTRRIFTFPLWASSRKSLGNNPSWLMVGTPS